MSTRSFPPSPIDSHSDNDGSRPIIRDTEESLDRGDNAFGLIMIAIINCLVNGSLPIAIAIDWRTI